MSYEIELAAAQKTHRLSDLVAGSFIRNITPVGIPFGGVGLSGVGRENRTVALQHNSQVKTVYVGMTPVQSL